jgi:apoptosis-inducing factor 3
MFIYRPGHTLKGIHVIRGVQDSTDLSDALASVESTGKKPNVVVVGSSFIGMEAAAILAKSCNVTVIGMEKVPFERVLGGTVGKALGELNVLSGVTLKMEAVTEKFVASGKHIPYPFVFII